MQTRQLGPFTVSAIGLGAMPLSMNNDRVYPSAEEAEVTIHAALDAGITFIDTADIYAPTWDTMGVNEELVGRALRSYGGSTDQIVVGTKGGVTRGPGESWGRDGSEDYLRGAVEKSLRALGTDVIDLYQWHRVDLRQPFSAVVEQFAALRDEGKIKAIGLSNVNTEQIELAVEILGEGGLASVQNEFSPKFRCSLTELTLCGELGVTFLPWSPLGGTGGGAREVGTVFSTFAEIGADHGVSPQQVVLAWELALGEHVVPIPGARRPSSITDSARAADLVLTEDEIERCSATPGLH